jgi:hypothetical protein
MAIALLVFIVVVAIGALVSGADSRLDEAARRRRFLS